MRSSGREPARVVELGYLAGATGDGRGQMYLWPEASIIAPQPAPNHTWRCELVATDRHHHAGRPVDADSYARPWQIRASATRVQRPHRRRAGVLAEGLRIPHP